MSDHIPPTATEDLDEEEEEAVVAGESVTDPGETVLPTVAILEDDRHLLILDTFTRPSSHRR